MLLVCADALNLAPENQSRTKFRTKTLSEHFLYARKHLKPFTCIDLILHGEFMQKFHRQGSCVPERLVRLAQAHLATEGGVEAWQHVK